jgi:hypothetical protein
MEIADIEAGKSYACKFKVRTFINKDGELVNTKNLQLGQAVDGEPGWYESFGVISKRDTDQQLVEVIEHENNDKEWVVPWEHCWDIDTVEWVADE